MANIIDVAQFFLGKADEDNEKITHLKLQKLCYYAKSWGLAIANDPIFDEKFQAWVHGPVNEKLYNIYKDYGFEQIFYDNALKTGTFTSRQKNFWRLCGKLMVIMMLKYLKDLPIERSRGKMLAKG